VPKAWEYGQATVYTAISKQDSTLVSMAGRKDRRENVDERASEKERKKDRRRQSR